MSWDFKHRCFEWRTFCPEGRCFHFTYAKLNPHKSYSQAKFCNLSKNSIQLDLKERWQCCFRLQRVVLWWLWGAGAEPFSPGKYIFFFINSNGSFSFETVLCIKTEQIKSTACEQLNILLVRYSTAVADVDIFDPEIETWTVGSCKIFGFLKVKGTQCCVTL